MSSPRPTDADLVLRCRRGERAAFDELVDRYRGVTYAVARRKLGNGDAAADAAQEALVEAYCSLASLRDPARFAAWLRAITLNLCADRHARAQRGATVALDAAEPAHATDPQQVAERQEVRRMVRAAVNGLSRANRLAVNLCYFDGLSCREVADFCGVSVSAIKSRLHEARRAIREGRVTMAEASKEREAGDVPSCIGYAGDGCVGVLFWKRARTRDLYLALYPEKVADDEGFWGQWQDVEGLEGHLRLWEYAGATRREDGRLIGLVPVYTEEDHERLAEWHARVSRAVLERINGEEGRIRELTADLRGGGSDPENLRHITVIGRLIGHCTNALLAEGFMGVAHDWGGLGRAYIWGMRGRNLPPTGGYSYNAGSSGPVHLVAFQHNDLHPGRRCFSEHGTERPIGLLGELVSAPRPRDEIIAEARDPSRVEAMVGELLGAEWLCERDGVLHCPLPWLPWSVQEDNARLRDLAETIVQPVADAAEELRALAAQCSFSGCRFTDVAYVAVSIALGYAVRDLRKAGLVAEYPRVIPPGWGAWLYVPEA